MNLNRITHPNQLHGLSIVQLQDIARQIRKKHLQTVATSGGHLGSGLGVVELTLGYISLYRGREEIKKVPESKGVEELINLIKADDRWVDPP